MEPLDIKEHIHRHIITNKESVDKWFLNHRQQMFVPVYLSVDIRDSGYKIAPVDANIFPAGFNNICQADQEDSLEIIKFYLENFYPDSNKKIAIITEEHTKNSYYWESVSTLKDILSAAKYKVFLTFPRELKTPLCVQTASGKTLTISPNEVLNERLKINDEFCNIVLGNNDFSESRKSWAKGLLTNPPRELGWHQRKKSHHFKYYNQFAQEFCHLIQVDPWLLQIETQALEGHDIFNEKGRARAVTEAKTLFDRLNKKYTSYGVSEKPYLFIKNDSGTYGLAVAKLDAPEDILLWNNRKRTKMKAAKGGGSIDGFIFQEGVRSTLTIDDNICEPTIYLFGHRLLGGFLRAHKRKDATESLNAPGAIYRKLCVSDLRVNIDGYPMENVYGWIAKISALAVGQEAKDLGISIH